MMDDLIILDSFVLPARGAETDLSFGIIVTSRRVFRFVMASVTSQGDELVCATDDTYKLHFGGWTLVDCGSEAVVWTRGSFIHQFVPCAYMFVRSETTAAYVQMFQVIRQQALDFFGVDVNVAYGSLDHSEAIASAFEEVWPDVCLLTCWTHLALQARKKRSLLSDAEMYDAMIKPQLQLLRSGCTHAQFIKMSVLVTDHWIASGEREYAQWLRSVYLTHRWYRRHMNGAGIGGVIPSQQEIESHHAVIKRMCAPSSRASTSAVVKSILPRILRYDGENLCSSSLSHIGDGPIPPYMMAKAARFLSHAGNYRRVFQGRRSRKRLVAILFNS
jgi:hypothetical protein